MRTVFFILCLLFSVYTALVYAYGLGTNAEPADAAILAGLRTWQEQNCQSCHQLYGLGGYMGPDLTNTFTVEGRSAHPHLHPLRYRAHAVACVERN